jgi:hypothetical protein
MEQTDMAVDQGQRREHVAARLLTRRELDARMQEVIEEVTAVREDESAGARQAAAERRPRWIEPAELVRRLERFIAYN